MERLMELQRGDRLTVNEAKVGKTMKVIIDREDPDYFVGRTSTTPQWTGGTDWKG